MALFPNAPVNYYDESDLLSSVRKPLAFVAVFLLGMISQSARGYSVLSHEETVDMAWSRSIVPLLLKRYPGTSPKELQIAHSYAYGGCIIQDLGYYPFGNPYFSDLLHYVRTGDFVNNLMKDATDVNEYAFALGALAHYRGDTIGHPAIGLATAREYPKLRRKFGPFVSYYDSPKAHIRTEFGFDVVQVAQGHYVKDDYRNFIGFNVAEPLLERAFKETYGVDLNTVLKHEDLAMNTYRYSVSTVIPEMTRAAVVDYGKEIQQRVPSFDRKAFVYKMDRANYQHDWGKQYRHPGPFAHVIAFLIRILPKKGPVSVFKLKMPNAADQQTYLDSMQKTVSSYESDLAILKQESGSDPHLPLPDLDYDTGISSHLGEYPLADKTYARLLAQLTHSKDADISTNLQANVLNYYAALNGPALPRKYRRHRWRAIRRNLLRMRREKPESDRETGD